MHADVFQTMNAGYAQLMYEQWRRDPASVDEEWRTAFGNGWKGVEPDEPSAVSRQPSAVSLQLSAVSRQPSAGRRPPPPSAAGRCASSRT
jgi:2-oxoglutarate dehydrogenase complex dehydrogenase (E1) component-like enzyme